MKLSSKIILAVAATVIATSLGGALTVYFLSRANRVDALHAQMSVVLRQAQTMAGNMDRMHQAKSFDLPGLVAAARAQSGGRPLHETYRDTALYNTIPIVAAWQAAEKSAREQGYEFYTPSRPGLAARNSKNDNGAEFAAAFSAFAAGEGEYFSHDRQNQELVLAVPVKLTESCLACHGDPVRSPTHDGKDILGFPMEGMKVGDVKGAFVLKAPLTHDAVIAGTMQSMSAVSFLLLLGAVAGFWGFSHRFINRPLNLAIQQLDDASSQVSAAAAEVSAASQTLAEGSSEQAASLEETSASLEEMSSMTKRNAEGAQQAKALSHQTRTAADQGSHHVTQMRSAMDGIKASSDEVAKIVKTIDEIAFQTNILALNAAVEAARAGDAGAGFAVVAEEVRALAQRSATAAKETADKIETAILKSTQGVEISGGVAASLGEIVEKARQVDSFVAEIAQASSEQSTGISQVNSAIGQMDQVTQANAGSAEETAAAAEELSAQALTLRDTVGQLRQLVGGDRATAPVVSARAPARPATKAATKVLPRRAAPAATPAGNDNLDRFFQNA